MCVCQFVTSLAGACRVACGTSCQTGLTGSRIVISIILDCTERSGAAGSTCLLVRAQFANAQQTCSIQLISSGAGHALRCIVAGIAIRNTRVASLRENISEIFCRTRALACVREVVFARYTGCALVLSGYTVGARGLTLLTN